VEAVRSTQVCWAVVVAQIQTLVVRCGMPEAEVRVFGAMWAPAVVVVSWAQSPTSRLV
jgi:hypothetical protein